MIFRIYDTVLVLYSHFSIIQDSVKYPPLNIRQSISFQCVVVRIADENDILMQTSLTKKKQRF